MFNEGGNRICSPELLAQIAEVIDSAVLITRFGSLGQFDHRIIYANPAFSKLTGYKANEILGRSPDVLCDPRNSGDKILEFYSKCMAGGRFNFEMGSFEKQGSELTLGVDVTPVIDETQGVHYYILTLKNLTQAQGARQEVPKHKAEPEPVYKPAVEEKEEFFDERFWQSPNNDLTPHNNEDYVQDLIQGTINQRLNGEDKQLKTPSEISTDEAMAEYSKTQFLANMSHDLRTPLNAIIGFSEVIKDQLFGPIENPRYVSYANDIFRSGQELFTTISEIMELSEVQHDEKIIDPERMNICDVIESVVDVLSPKAFESDIKILKTFDARDLRLEGDRRKIKQAIAGIVGNAIKYSEKGSKIEISAALNEKGDLKLVFYAKSANILNTKSPLHGTITKKVESEYPEISLAKKFIEAHDGRFQIFNSATSGTEISIILPSSRLSMEPEKKTLLKVIS